MRKRAVIRCTHCHRKGHNRATCTWQPPEPPNGLVPIPKREPLTPETTTSCAQCGDPVGDTNYYAPIGRDDAMVRLCKRCELEAVPNHKHKRRTVRSV